MKTSKIVLIRCPQPLLVGQKTGAMYSSNRALTPEPTLPQLHGIIKHFSQMRNIPIEVIQLDLRDPVNGKIEEVCYGELKLPYLNEPLKKVYSGVSLAEKSILADADFIGFTNNFAMSRRVVADHIAKVRSMFPEKEIWIGGRDVFTSRVENVYVNAASRKKVVVFEGHVFESLQAYLLWKIKGEGEPFGITIFDDNGHQKYIPPQPLNSNIRNGEVNVPLPVYLHPESLEYFTGSGEGAPSSPFGRFVHMTISIGCPNACGYCTTGYRERYLVHKDMATIRAELEYYKQLGVKTIAIMDDNLLCLGVKKVKQIMELVNSYRFQIEYGNGLQLSLLAKHWDELKGPIFQQCVSLYAPLEDLTQNRLYNKLDPTASQLALMKRIARERPGMLKYVTMGVIIGVPGHTKKALETTFMDNMKKFLNVFKGSGLEVAMTVFNFMPLSGTKFGELALNSGRMVVVDPIAVDPEVCSFGTTSYAPEGMTHGEVYKLYQQALNLNPAGKSLGVFYVDLQQFGEKIFPQNERWKVPHQWKVSGYHLRDKVI
jgi:radical SAM superfamily enzyme YgiQ (UPF0313 family)